MKKLLLSGIGFIFFLSLQAQRTDKWLDELLRSNASPLLLHILNSPDTFQVQFIYTQIDRDQKNRPSFKNFYLNVDPQRYFNPASMVKMPLAFLSLEKLNGFNVKAIDKYTSMLTDSSFERQTRVSVDTSAENGFPSIAHYIRKIFLVSDNDAYSRLYEFLGQGYINSRLKEKGYKDARITRRFTAVTAEQNRHTNAIRFVKDGKELFVQPPAYNADSFDFRRKILVGKGRWDSNDSLINEPMDFTTHNNMPLEDLQQIAQSVLFPESVVKSKRFNLKDDDYKFLYRAMSQLPSESIHPKYDTTEYFDSYTKFFMFKSGRGKIPSYIRVFNKTGWSYGFLTDVSYIVDFKNKVEFMLSAVIYVNSDGILNDNKYEYDEIGYPFFKETGNLIYQFELQRKRKNVPDLSRFFDSEIKEPRN